MTILQNKRLMEKEDSEASAIIHGVFHKEGVRIVLGDKKVTKVEVRGNEKIIFWRGRKGRETGPRSFTWTSF